MRLGGVFDLHAAGARYHRDCMSKFFAFRNMQPIQTHSDTSDIDPGIEAVISLMLENKSNLWNTAELYDVYMKHSPRPLTRPYVIDTLKNKFGDDIIVLSCLGQQALLLSEYKRLV